MHGNGVLLTPPPCAPDSVLLSPQKVGFLALTNYHDHKREFFTANSGAIFATTGTTFDLIIRSVSLAGKCGA